MAFDGILDSGFVNSETYHHLENELSFKEITPELVGNISQNIMDLYGEVCPNICQTNIYNGDFFNNAAMETTFCNGQIDNGNLLYDQNFLWHTGQQYGIDAITGIIAHEMGHQITNEVFENSGVELTDWQNELCADYLSGIASRLAELAPDSMHNFYGGEGWMPSDTHPAGGLRTEAFDKGYEWASNSLNETYSDFILKDPSAIKSILEKDVLNSFTTY